jgi:hypothetical protein
VTITALARGVLAIAFVVAGVESGSTTSGQAQSRTAAIERDLTPPFSERHGAFALANIAGTQLIVLHELRDPALFRLALCAGRSFPILAAGRQSERDADRDTPEQFERLGGTLFEVIDHKVPSGDTCLVVPLSRVQGASVLPVRSEPYGTECTAQERQRVAAVRDRPMKGCWSVGAVQSGGLVVVAEYARVQRDALASLIVLTDRRRAVVDFPAEFRGDGEDLWRADDGGEFSPDGFVVPFVVVRDATMLVPVLWHGAESLAVSLHVADGSAPSRALIADSWYRAPR